MELIEQTQSLHPSSLLKILKLQTLIAPVIASAALYCTDSILFENGLLDCWSKTTSP